MSGKSIVVTVSPIASYCPIGKAEVASARSKGEREGTTMMVSFPSMIYNMRGP